jgi:type IV secretory pathway TrbD component
MRIIKLHRSLWKPILIMGCERTPFLIIMVSSLLLIVEGGFTIKIIGVVFFVVMTGILAFLNNKDPFFCKVGFRFLRQQTFYASSANYPSKPDYPKNKG